MLKARVLALCLIVSLWCVPLLAQTPADKELLDRIRQEEKDNPQIMKTECIYQLAMRDDLLPRFAKDAMPPLPPPAAAEPAPAKPLPNTGKPKSPRRRKG
jgi:hypothetical protein